MVPEVTATPACDVAGMRWVSGVSGCATTKWYLSCDQYADQVLSRRFRPGRRFAGDRTR